MDRIKLGLETLGLTVFPGNVILPKPSGDVVFGGGLDGFAEELLFFSAGCWTAEVCDEGLQLDTETVAICALEVDVGCRTTGS